MNRKKEVIFLVDMQSFYASVEVAANPSLAGKPVVVCGDPAKRHGITLAASPEAKKAGVKTAMPVWQVKSICPDACFVKPHMQRYIEASIQITEILNEFTELVEPYSIDEQFMSVSMSQKLFGSANNIAKILQQRIQDEVGVWARVGVGENKIQAKMACDNFAKKNIDGIFLLNHDNYMEITGPLGIDKLFGVGSRMKINLERVGIYTISDLTARPLAELKKRWGVNGHVLWLSAQGIDHSPVESNSTELQKGVGNSITLPKDYSLVSDIEVVMLELTEEVARRARLINKRGRTIQMGVRGADLKHPTGFSRQLTLPFPSNDGIELYNYAKKLFNQHWNGAPVRSIGVSLTQLEEATEVQLNLFSNPLEKAELSKVMDQVRNRYGKTAIFRGSSLLPAGLLFDRATKIGGHEA